MTANNIVRLLRLCKYPIEQQLKLEEALLRASQHNWCLINDGTPDPTIVLGISGKLHEWVDVPAAQQARATLLRRFSGGGTVVVDHNTIFVSLVLGQEALPAVDPFPHSIMRWSEGLYKRVFPDHLGFAVRDNDYIIGIRKCGGNAQAITGKRWLHHTSFLWDYDVQMMKLLRHPPRMPAYRQDRRHEDFLCRMSDTALPRNHIAAQLPAALECLGLQVQEAALSEAEALIPLSPLIGTKRIQLN